MAYSTHYEACEECGQRGPYCRHYRKPAEGFAARAALAADCISTGDGIGSRGFDNCFEMYDGDFVMMALLHMADRDARLWAGFKKHFANAIAQDQFSAVKMRLGHIPEHKLADAASAHRQRERTRGDCNTHAAQLALI